MIIDQKNIGFLPMYYSGHSEETGRALQAACDAVGKPSSSILYLIMMICAWTIGGLLAMAGALSIIGCLLFFVGPTLPLILTVLHNRKVEGQRQFAMNLRGELISSGQLHSFNSNLGNADSMQFVISAISDGFARRGHRPTFTQHDFMEFVERNDEQIGHLLRDPDVQMAHSRLHGPATEASKQVLRASLRQRMQSAVDTIVDRELTRREQLEIAATADVETLIQGLSLTAQVEEESMDALLR